MRHRIVKQFLCFLMVVSILLNTSSVTALAKFSHLSAEEPHVHNSPGWSCDSEDVLVCGNTDAEHSHSADCYQTKWICAKNTEAIELTVEYVASAAGQDVPIADTYRAQLGQGEAYCIELPDLSSQGYALDRQNLFCYTQDENGNETKKAVEPEVDENGKYYNAAETDAFLEAMNWVMDMVSKYEMKAPEGAEWNYFESAFINGEVALQVHEDYFAGSLSNMEDDYGFVFFPKGPRVDTYLYAPSDSIMVIPACYDADRAWKIAFAYNLFTNPTPGYSDSDDWKNGYYQKYRDERAVDETITMMREPEHQFVWYSDMVTGYDLGSQYIWDVYAQATTPAEKAESMRGTWQAYIDEANAN